MSNIRQEHVKIIAPADCALFRIHDSGKQWSDGEFQPRKIQGFQECTGYSLTVMSVQQAF